MAIGGREAALCRGCQDEQRDWSDLCRNFGDPGPLAWSLLGRERKEADCRVCCPCKQGQGSEAPVFFTV